MAALEFNASLVVRIDEGDLTTEDVERRLASILHDAGYVKDSYEQAIIDREASYPTALEVGEINVAMPHCDVEHVERGAICVGLLAHPVAWHRMDDFEAETPVSLVVMLALNEAHAHLEMLQKVIGLVQDQELVARALEQDSEGAYALLADKLA